MAVRVIERPKQSGTISFRAPKASREYCITGTLVKLEAQIAVAAAVPSADTGIDENGNVIQIFLKTIDLKEVGGGTWEAVCQYENTPSQFDLKFNIGTQSVKTKQALEHIRTYDCLNGGYHDGPGDFTDGIPDFKGAIGVNGENIDGVDIEISKIEFTITVKHSFASLSASYLWTIANMTPSVNDDDFSFTFKGQTFVFPKGSVLFRNAPMSVTSDDVVEFQYMFAYSRNTSLTWPAWDAGTTYSDIDMVTYQFQIFKSLTVGNINTPPVTNQWTVDQTYGNGALTIWGGHIYQSIKPDNQGHKPDDTSWWEDNGLPNWKYVGPATGELVIGNSDPIVKEGWWYMWPWYQMQVVAGGPIPVPRAVVIDRVYDYGNFALLELFVLD